MTLYYILIFVLILGLVILVHEFGHFLFAKRAGILCHEFSIGMGPAIYKKKVGETVYAIRAIPIGGYVAAAGEDPEVSQIKTGQTVYLELKNNVVEKIHFNRPLMGNTIEAVITDFDLYGKDGNPLYISYRNEGKEHRVTVMRDAMYVFDDKRELQIAPYDRCYESKPWLSRFLFVTMGAGFNFIFATLIFILYYLISGIPTTEPIISNPHSELYTTAAEAAGLQKGDRIIKIGGKAINEWSDITAYMRDYNGGPIVITIDRNGETIQREVRPNLMINSLGVISDGNTLEDTVIAGLRPNSPADKAGLKKGDRIIAVEDVSVSRWDDVLNELSKYYKGQTIKLTIERTGETNPRNIEITPLKVIVDYENLEKNPEEEMANIKATIGQYLIGISPQVEHRFFTSISYGFKETFYQIGSVIRTIGLLVGNNNVGVSDLSGPLGIFDMTRTTAMAGFMSLLFWLGFISANIGFVNLLPLPALDGGRLLFLIIEGVTRRPVNRKIEGYVHTVGFVLLMMLFIYVTFNDILRLRG